AACCRRPRVYLRLLFTSYHRALRSFPTRRSSDLGADTRHAEALYLLALCSRDLGDREESIGYYERLVEVLPEAPRPKAELAALYAHVGRVAETRRLYRRAARLPPGTASAAMFEQLAVATISDNPAQVTTTPKLRDTNAA